MSRLHAHFHSKPSTHHDFMHVLSVSLCVSAVTIVASTRINRHHCSFVCSLVCLFVFLLFSGFQGSQPTVTLMCEQILSHWRLAKEFMVIYVSICVCSESVYVGTIKHDPFSTHDLDDSEQIEQIRISFVNCVFLETKLEPYLASLSNVF